MSYFDVPSIWREHQSCLIDYYVLQNCNYYYVTWLCHTLMYLLFEESTKVVSLTIMYYRTVTIIMLPGYVILWCTFYLKRAKVVSLTIMYYRTVTIIMLPGYVILWCTFYLKRAPKLSHWLLCITEL